MLTRTAPCREDLREQHAIGEEINEAITQRLGNDPLDEDELEDELAELQQEELDDRMLKTGTVPVADTVSQMPSASRTEREYTPALVEGRDAKTPRTNLDTAKGKALVAMLEEDDEEEELRKLQAEMAM